MTSGAAVAQPGDPGGGRTPQVDAAPQAYNNSVLRGPVDMVKVEKMPWRARVSRTLIGTLMTLQLTATATMIGTDGQSS